MYQFGLFKHTLLKSTLTAAIIAGMTMAASAAADSQVFNIKSQPLAKSLLEYSDSTDIIIMAPTKLVRDKQAPALQGSFSSAKALETLLAGSGLTYSQGEDGSIRIELAGAVDPNSEAGEREHERKNNIIEEMIVTAQKREQSVKDVPVSITTLSEDLLDKNNVTSIDDLSVLVPGLVSTGAGGGQSRFVFLRGMANTSGFQPAVGLYLDEVPVNAQVNAQLDIRTYDLERIEVLKGPQGTLYGQGSMGGTIRYITNKPNLEAMEGWVEADVSSISGGGVSPGGSGAISVPLVQDQLAIRVSGEFRHEGGWLNAPATQLENVNDSTISGGRVSLLWRPTDTFQLNLMAVVHDNEFGYQSGDGDENQNVIDIFGQTTPQSGDEHYDLYNATLTYDFGAASLISSSSYYNYAKSVHNWSSAAFPSSATPIALYWDFLERNGDAFSQELRLQSAPGQFEWETGAYYRDYRFGYNYVAYIGPSTATELPDTPRTGTYSRLTSSKSYAVFGNTSVKFAERWEVGAGLRYFEDEAYNYFQTGTFDTWSPRVFAVYTVSDDINLYANIAKGFRSGRFNSNPAYLPADPEQAWTYELGVKGTLLDGMLYTEFAVYRTDYQDYQTISAEISPTQGSIVRVSNSGNARIEGVDLLVDWYLTDTLNVTANAALMDAKMIEQKAGDTSLFVGDVLDYTPDYQFSVSARKEFNMAGRPASFLVSYTQRDKLTSTNRRYVLNQVVESDEIKNLRADISLNISDTVELSLYGDNLLNNYSRVVPDTPDGLFTQPRTVGVKINTKF